MKLISRLFTAFIFTSILLLSQNLLSKDTQTIQNLDSNKMYSGKVIFKNGKQLKSNEFQVKNNFLILNNFKKHIKDSFPLQELSILKISNGTMANTGLIFGLVLGVLVSIDVTFQASYVPSSKVVSDCLAVIAISSGIGLLIGSMTNDYSTYLNNEYLSLSSEIKYDYVFEQSIPTIKFQIRL